MTNSFDLDLPFDEDAMKRDIERDLAAATPENLLNGPFLSTYRAWVDNGTIPQKSPEDLLVESGVPKKAIALSMTAMMLRDIYIAEFGFSVPTPAFIDLMKNFGAILEVGAGQGYLSQVLRHSGVDSIATDANPGHMEAVRARAISEDNLPTRERNLPVDVLTAEEAIKAYPGRTILCSWPDYQSDWITKAAAGMAKGQRLAVIGEGYGGCTGEDGLFDLVEAGDFEFDRAHQDLQDRAIWSFPAIHDRLRIFRKI